MEVDGQFFEACADASRLLHPSDARFDHGASPIRPSIEAHPTVIAGCFVLFVGDHRFDAAGSKPITDTRNAVAFIGGQFLGALARRSQALGDGNAVHHRLDLRRFMDLPGRNLNGQRSAATVSNQVEFRTKPASAAAQCVVCRFIGMPVETFLSAPPAARAARTLAPSMHQRSQSIRPRSSSLICMATTIAAKTPSRRHLAKWWYTVCQGPRRSGRSLQGAPVCRIQKMPLSIVRRSREGRPVRAVLHGTSGSINAHCSSMSSWRFMLADLPVVMQGYRQNQEFSDRA